VPRLSCCTRQATVTAPAVQVRRARRPARGTRPVRRAALGGALAASLLTLAACDGGPIAQDTAASNGQSFVSGSDGTTLFTTGSRPPEPALAAKTLAGQSVRLASYRGDLLVINFWGSWCAPCRAEAPTLGTLARQLWSKDVRFLGVDTRDTTAGAEAFMRTFRISYPSLNDANDQIALAFRGTVPPTGIPTTLLIDRSGHIAARIVGEASYTGLKALIARVDAVKT
jgi:thiol-disulfide isomerase/thioredoxin